MGIQMTQTCEMCGRKRDLPMTSGHPKTPQSDSGGWRSLDSGNKEATLCSHCILIVVYHAIERARARQSGTPGTLNDRPLVARFTEAYEADQ